MTESLRPVSKTSGSEWTRKTEWQIRLTLLCLLFERIWPRLWPAMGIAGLYLVLSLWDTWLLVPGVLHFGLLIGFVTWIGVSIWQSFASLQLPKRGEALRRLEIDNALSHRPLSTLTDRPALDKDDPTVRTLWAHNKVQLARSLSKLRLHGPKSALPGRDPFALRALLLLLIIPSFYVAGNDWRERLVFAVQPQLTWRSPTVTEFDAWIDPPSYTGAPPIFLTSKTGAPSPNETIEIPANSLLLLRTPGGSQSSFSFKSTAKSMEWETADNSGGGGKLALRLEQSQDIRIRQHGRDVGQWQFRAITDRAPAITLSSDLRGTIRGTLEIAYAVRDDYGVAKASAQFVTSSKSNDNSPKEILKVPLALPSQMPTHVDETAFHDLTAHPWAGLEVDVELVAIDEIGQIGRSEKYQTVLPARSFAHPLAKAIIEQRQNLALAPQTWPDVALALDALAILSSDLADDYTLYLGLRSAFWSLMSRAPTRMSEIEDVYALLWDLALRLEEGDVAEAEADLRLVQQALMDALARGADASEIETLFAEYDRALNRYLQALSEQALENTQSQTEPYPIPQNAEQLRAEDLQKLLDDIRGLAATGDMAEARQMLAQLQRMLENLSTDVPPPMSAGQAQMTETIEELSSILRQQRNLLDETFANAASSNAIPPVRESPLGAPAAETGQRQSSGENLGDPTPLQGLAGDQQNLREQLGDLRNRLEELAPGAEGSDALAEAEESMALAAGSLEQNYGPSAETNQKSAIEQLSEGANALAQQLMEQLSAQGRQDRQSGESQDPLGRNPGSATSFGDHIKVPAERDLQRAREILEELQRRAGETGRPTLELEYLERLLKRF